MNHSEIQQHEQWSLSFHQWLTCEAYLGHCSEFNGSTQQQRPSIEERLDRAVATLHRRTEQPTYVAQEAYVCVVPTGLQVSVGPANNSHEVHNPGPLQRISKTFSTGRIARCTSNHQACPRIFVWVCERSDGSVNNGLECHGILCYSARDAIRLAHTLSTAFQYVYQQTAAIQRMSIPMRRGNALPPLSHHSTIHHQLQEIPFADIVMLPTYNTQQNSGAVKGNETSRTYAGDMTVAISTIAPPAYQSRPGSAMSVSARRVSSPVFPDGAVGGMTYLD
ncbi:uncharacterized protein [Amphiura filiformis]|uniref:uncharacterized protein n=1 Tax=Amphiura filiformis TaxID=82378 RepID=UPI003B21F2BC